MSERVSQPWHAEDEKPSRRSHAPIGTHSFTGGGAAVGQPEVPRHDAPERGDPPGSPPLQQPAPLAEPRAGTADSAGRRT